MAIGLPTLVLAPRSNPIRGLPWTSNKPGPSTELTSSTGKTAVVSKFERGHCVLSLHDISYVRVWSKEGFKKCIMIGC